MIGDTTFTCDELKCKISGSFFQSKIWLTTRFLRSTIKGNPLSAPTFPVRKKVRIMSVTSCLKLKVIHRLRLKCCQEIVVIGWHKYIWPASDEFRDMLRDKRDGTWRQLPSQVMRVLHVWLRWARWKLCKVMFVPRFWTKFCPCISDGKFHWVPLWLKKCLTQRRWENEISLQYFSPLI